MNKKMYHLYLKVYEFGRLKSSYDFSAVSKREVFNMASHAFDGFVLCLGEFSHEDYERPCVFTLDGFKVWSKIHRICLENYHCKVVRTFEDVV